MRRETLTDAYGWHVVDGSGRLLPTHAFESDDPNARYREEPLAPGMTLRVEGPVRLCAWGLHAALSPLDLPLYVFGDPGRDYALCLVALRGDGILGLDKAVVTERTVLAMWPMPVIVQALRQYAAGVAQAVLAVMLEVTPDDGAALMNRVAHVLQHGPVDNENPLTWGAETIVAYSANRSQFISAFPPCFLAPTRAFAGIPPHTFEDLDLRAFFDALDSTGMAIQEKVAAPSDDQAVTYSNIQQFFRVLDPRVPGTQRSLRLTLHLGFLRWLAVTGVLPTGPEDLSHPVVTTARPYAEALEMRYDGVGDTERTVRFAADLADPAFREQSGWTTHQAASNQWHQAVYPVLADPPEVVSQRVAR